MLTDILNHMRKLMFMDNFYDLLKLFPLDTPIGAEEVRTLEMYYTKYKEYVKPK